MKYYFAADIHLGSPMGDTREREQKFVLWLDKIKTDATEIFLLGDIFDFWCEYKKVVPRGFVRTLGKLAEITDSGIPVHFFIGNHDLWLTDYLQNEVGLIVHTKSLEIALGEKYFYLAHGDYVDKTYFFRRVFANKFLQLCFRAIHPRWGVALAHKWSKCSHKSQVTSFNEEQEFSVRFARQFNRTNAINHFIFGHRHTPIQYSLNEQSQLTILGDWFNGCEYAIFDGETVSLKY